MALSADGNTALIGGNDPYTVNQDGGHETEARGDGWLFSRSGGILQGQPAQLTGGGLADSGPVYGCAVALSSDATIALVGQPLADGEKGGAWAFTNSGGAWASPQSLAPPGQSPGRYGYSVALSGDGTIALVGAQTGDGGVWAFTGSNGAYGNGVPIPLPGTGAQFGSSVALSSDGTTALIGGIGANGGGAAWVYDTQSWTQPQETLKPPSASPYGWFGFSAALSKDGSVALVGSPRNSVNDETPTGDVGAAWVFTRTNGEWTQPGLQLPTPTGLSPGTPVWFGASVALSQDGTVSLIGGPGSVDGSGVPSGVSIPGGMAWVYALGPWRYFPALVPASLSSRLTSFLPKARMSWRQAQTLTGSGAAAGSAFGRSVALCVDASTALVGGPGDAGGAGAAWPFSSKPEA